MPSIAEWCTKVHNCACAHGWWDKERKFPEIIALLHSEVTEAFELYRKGHPTYGIGYNVRSNKPEGIAIELADVVIRVMDYCARRGIDLEAAIEAKHTYNLTRPYRHGGKIV